MNVSTILIEESDNQIFNTVSALSEEKKDKTSIKKDLEEVKNLLEFLITKL